MTISQIRNWTEYNMNCNNMLVFNGISIESHIYMIGIISDRLFDGAIHFLYKYCKMIKTQNVPVGLRHIEYLRAYLKMFLAVFKRIVQKIHVILNINVANNVHVIRLEHNLKNMIDITSLSNYFGQDDHQKLISMQKAVQKEYRLLLPIYMKNISITIVKEKYLILPVLRLYEYSNTLLSPKVNIYR